MPGPHAWMAHAGCRLEITLPELQTPALADAALVALGLSDLKKLAAKRQVEPLGDKRRKQTWIAALQSPATTSSTRTLDVTVTGWDNKDRTVTVQPCHSMPGDAQTTLHLDHPFNSTSTPTGSCVPAPGWRAASSATSGPQTHLAARTPRAVAGFHLGRVPGQQGDDRALRLRKRHNDAGSGTTLPHTRTGDCFRRSIT